MAISSISKSTSVQLLNQTVCRKCPRGMETVAIISPMAGKPV
jgi:hypothetical protein